MRGRNWIPLLQVVLSAFVMVPPCSAPIHLAAASCCAAGHPDHHIHSGERALIHPWAVLGLGKRQVHRSRGAQAGGGFCVLHGSPCGKDVLCVWNCCSTKRILTLPQVVGLASGKHHMVVCTSSGEVFSWGSNKDGKLGYGGTDTQPTPKKVALLRQRISHVAASNKHSAAISAAGEVRGIQGANACCGAAVPGMIQLGTELCSMIPTQTPTVRAA